MQQQEEAAHSLHPLQVGPQPLNTPEELRAIRQAMGEGKNPLVATDVPRWEDQVGVSSHHQPPRIGVGAAAHARASAR